MKSPVGLIFLLLILNSNYGLAQVELKDNQFEGYIIKDGKKMEGIVEIDNINRPWTFQYAIKFFDSALLAQEKVEDKDKTKFKPGEISEYGIGEKRYVVVEYTNKNNGPNNSNQVNSAISGIKSLKKKKYFAEVYYQGQISLYRFYNSPPEFYMTVGDEEKANMEKFIEECKTSYDILIEREGEKAKSFEDTNIKKFFKDCKFVLEKFADKQYTKKPAKGIKSMISNAFLVGEPLANAAMEMIVDFEANCIE